MNNQTIQEQEAAETLFKLHKEPPVLFNHSLLEDKINVICDKISLIFDKLNTIEKTYISLNADLIIQNIKISEQLHGKLEEPQFEMPQGSSEQVKELFYYQNNGRFIIYGPGTFDNRPQLKQYGEWNSSNKTWVLNNITEEELLLKFPKIIKKEKDIIINDNEL
jgi:hypothetical protein